MANERWRKRLVGNRALSPETLMMGYGYDPFLSERSLKPPVFHTSTFVFRTGAGRHGILRTGCHWAPWRETAGILPSASILT